MDDVQSRRVHKLAREYYQGNLDFSVYRRERNQLLDSITLQSDSETALLKTRPMSAAGREQAPRSRGRLFGWILVISLLTGILVAWLIMTGRITSDVFQVKLSLSELAATDQIATGSNMIKRSYFYG